MEAFDILKAFGEYSNYNPDQTHFNLLSNDWMLHNAGNVITDIIDHYDPTGNMAVLYAKRIYARVVNDSRVKLMDILSHEEDYLREKKMYDLFNSKEVKHLESVYINALNDVILLMTGKKEIGGRDLEAEKNNLYNAIEGVVEQLGKCHEDVYINSEKPVSEINNISTKIHLFNYMADCVLTIQNNAPDGAYFCYINNNGTADGYFAIVIKSNGNLFSINDRVSETYIGQHTRSRNGRWAESHKDIFPYEFVLSFDNYDYKGYAHKYNIDESKLSFSDLEPTAYIPVILAILCVINSRKGKILDNQKQVYLNTLIKGNIEKLSESTALIAIDKTGLIDSTTKILDIHFDRDKFLNGEYDEKYTGHKQHGKNQKFIDLYGMDFEPKTKTLSMTAKNILCSGKKSDTPHAEFVGSIETMEQQVYYETRMELADHIRKKMKKELDQAGGLQGVYKWFTDSMKENMVNMYPVIAYAYERYLENPNQWSAYNENDPEWVKHVHLMREGELWYPPNKYSKDCAFVYNQLKEGTKAYERQYICPVSGAKATYIFRFTSHNWKDIEAYTGKKVIKILENWRSDRYHGSPNEFFYGGNKILDIVDAVDFISPFDSVDESIYFDYYIAFSKRGLNKLLKDLKANSGRYLPEQVVD